jgi:acyl-CoA dehydrogenase
VDVKSDIVAERLARIRADIEAVSAYVRQSEQEITRCRARGDNLADPAVQIHLNTLKVLASELTFRAADRCVQLAGMGLGYRADSPIPLERHLRDLRSASLNYANDRLLTATGTLCLADRAVRLIGDLADPA